MIHHLTGKREFMFEQHTLCNWGSNCNWQNVLLLWVRVTMRYAWGSLTGICFGMHAKEETILAKGRKLIAECSAGSQRLTCWQGQPRDYPGLGRRGCRSRLRSFSFAESIQMLFQSSPSVKWTIRREAECHQSKWCSQVVWTDTRDSSPQTPAMIAHYVVRWTH